MNLSIVTTLYMSAPYLSEFHRRATEAVRQLSCDSYEIVMVNDGSPDSSLQDAIALAESDEHVVVVDLSRNFGHHKAMMTGLSYARGDFVFLIDSDLEEDPEWLQEFYAKMQETGSDVVYGVQESRKGGWFERWSGDVYYSIFNALSGVNHPRNIVTARLMTSRYTQALLQHKEREMIISCLWVTTGFKQHPVVVKKHMSSASTYSLFSKTNLAVNAIISYSSIPLKLAFYVGLCIFILAILFASYLIVMRLSMDQAVEGWASVMVSVWLLGGLIIFFIGLVGMYLSRIYSETKQRPYTIVRDVYGQCITKH